MEEMASDEVLEEAYTWLCKRRENYSHNDDVWEAWYRAGDLDITSHWASTRRRAIGSTVGLFN